LQLIIVDINQFTYAMRLIAERYGFQNDYRFLTDQNN